MQLYIDNINQYLSYTFMHTSWQYTIFYNKDTMPEYKNFTMKEYYDMLKWLDEQIFFANTLFISIIFGILVFALLFRRGIRWWGILLLWLGAIPMAIPYAIIFFMGLDIFHELYGYKDVPYEMLWLLWLPPMFIFGVGMAAFLKWRKIQFNYIMIFFLSLLPSFMLEFIFCEPPEVFLPI